MRDIESHFKRKKKFAISILLLMVAGWGVFSFYIIFIRLGWDDVQAKIRITKVLDEAVRLKKKDPIRIVRGWPIASTREKIDLDAVKRKLEQSCMTGLKEFFKEPPFIHIRQFSGWKRNCYLGFNIAIYPEQCFKSDILREQANEKIRHLFDVKLKEIFPQDSEFYKKLPKAFFMGNKLELGPELKDVKIPGKLRTMFIGRGGQPGIFIFTTYPALWDVKYDSSSAELVDAEEIICRKGTAIIEIPVENSKGEQYRMLVRVENK